MSSNTNIEFFDTFKCQELQIFDTPTHKELDEIGQSYFESIWINHGDASELSEVIDVSAIKHVRFSSNTKQDVSWLSSLENLRYLSLFGDLKGPIDFEQFAHIEELYVEICKATEGILTSSITPKCLELNKFKGTLDKLPSSYYESVSELTLSGSSITSLHGLGFFKKLDFLSLARCSKLKDIAELAFQPDLIKVYISGSNKVSDYTVLRTLKSLEEFYFMNKSLPSLKLLNSNRLRFVELGDSTTVDDMDIEALIKIPSMRRAIYTKRKDYSMGAVEMQEVLDKKINSLQ